MWRDDRLYIVFYTGQTPSRTFRCTNKATTTHTSRSEKQKLLDWTSPTKAIEVWRGSGNELLGTNGGRDPAADDDDPTSGKSENPTMPGSRLCQL